MVSSKGYAWTVVSMVVVYTYDCRLFPLRPRESDRVPGVARGMECCLYPAKVECNTIKFLWQRSLKFVLNR